MENANVLVTKFIQRTGIAFKGKNQSKLIMDPAKNPKFFTMEFVSVQIMLFSFLDNASFLMIKHTFQHKVLGPFLIPTPFVDLP